MAKADSTSSDLVLGLLAVCPKCEIRLEKKERSWTQIQKAVLYLYLYFLEANYIYTGSEEIIQNHPGGGGRNRRAPPPVEATPPAPQAPIVVWGSTLTLPLGNQPASYG